MPVPRLPRLGAPPGRRSPDRQSGRSDRLAPVLHLLAVAEPSKVPWFIAGGAAALWAVIVSAIGLRKPNFPGNEGGARIVMLISVVLVAAAMTAAVATG